MNGCGHCQALEARITRIEHELELQPMLGRCAGPAMRLVIEDCSTITGIAVPQILGRGRSPEVAFARFAIIWAIREELGYSFPRIGRALGRRDHTTILAGYKRAEALRRSDSAFSGLSEQLQLLAAVHAVPFIEMLMSDAVPD